MNISKSILFQNSRKGTKKIAVFKTFFAKFSKDLHAYTKGSKNPVFISISRICEHTPNLHKAYISLHRFNLVTI